MSTRIPYTKPSITSLEIEYATDAATNGWGEHCYDYIHRFEEGFSEHLGVEHVIATSSCTGALHMGLAALGIGPGDEVILADTNWIATVAPITYLGATPVLVDIRADTWCIDPHLAERAITRNTVAIIATHLYGNLCEMDELIDIGERHGISIIEDAAEAIGSTYHGKRAGSMGKFGTFSFHGTKTMTTGEGGAFVTSDSTMFEAVLTLSNHGRSRTQTKQFWPDTVGYKYKMSNVQAAIGCAQLERVDALVARKREILAYYRERLSSVPDIMLNVESPNTVIGAWMPTVAFDRSTGVSRERLLEAFDRASIDARVFFWPLSSLMPLGDAALSPVSHDVPDRAINLPSFHDITWDELERVSLVVESALDD